MRRFHFTIILLALLVPVAHAQTPHVLADALGGGATDAEGPGYQLHGSVGAAPAGPSGSSEAVLLGGFWAQARSAVAAPLYPPAVPMLSAPGDGETGLLPPVELTWDAAAHAASYQVQISGLPDFSTLLVDSTGLEETTLSFSNVEAGAVYYWRVQGINSLMPGGFSESRWFQASESVASEPVDVPTEYRLEPNYPNPFNPSTQIRFALPQSGRVLLVIYDVQGREIARLIDREMPVGVHAVTWSGRSSQGGPAPSGVYFYRLDAEGFSRTRSMHLVK